ncbi:DNA topoisomerase (ATP-hydrolyzing) [Bacteroidia bacterium]|nr:DNA topoisomerase (ATP-hydrolyzing) [Bacteroidia bacterium]
MIAYTEENIITLDWIDHIRRRPGMYIGKIGDGSSHDDGIYVLLKEVIDNSIDEFVMGNGRIIEVKIEEETVTVRDYGRGIPLNKTVDCVSKMNTGGKYDSKAFKKSVGLNGVGTKAVNALSSYFKVQSIRDGQTKSAEFTRGVLSKEEDLQNTTLRNGTKIVFTPDAELFKNYHYRDEYVEKMLWNYAYLNNGLTIKFNDLSISAKNGLYNLLTNTLDREPCYPIIHLKDEDFELAFTHHPQQYGEEYVSFVNGQYTPQGGTHQAAFREAIVRTIREFYRKEFDAADIRAAIVAALSIRVQEPTFESQTKTKLGSTHTAPEGKGETIRNFIGNIVKKQLDDYLHINSETAELLLQKIVQNEKERKGMDNIKKLARDSAKKVSVHNKKLCDCRVHYNSNDERKLETTLFITEGDSAGGSVTKVRDVNIQAVFKLRGKPKNTYKETKEFVYRNEELNMLQAALNIEDDLENLRYNNIVIATDADVDGMHIRLLVLTFFLKFYPDLVRSGHVYILQTPLFRVRKKDQTFYCYSDNERVAALRKLGEQSEITRFKGLGEISPDEFKTFIGPEMRIDPVILRKDSGIDELLKFYMGDNTPERQDFIIQNLNAEIEA